MEPEREAALQAAIDRQLEIERKARAWDAWYAQATELQHAQVHGEPLTLMLDRLLAQS